MKKSLTPLKYAAVFLTFLELFFWAGSWVTQTTQSWANTRQASANAVYKILCVGESNTLVGGKDSYPSQLEVILNERLPGRKFQVINQGMAGYSTTRIAQELGGWITSYKPDMVMAMIGIFDAEQERRDATQNSPLGFLQKTKLYWLAVQLQQKMSASLETYIQRQKQQFLPHPEPAAKTSMAGMTEHEMFQDTIKNAPEDLRKIYMLIAVAEGSQKYDIAEQLYAKFFSMNTNSIIFNWVIKQYGRFLMKAQRYDRFVDVMIDIPANAWSMDWVKGYCQGDEQMNKVRLIIEKKVAKSGDTDAYGYVASCYENGGRKDLANAYIQEKMKAFKDSYTSPVTRKSYAAIKEIILSKQVQPVFVQYPLRDIKTLLSIFENDPDKKKIIFVDNGPRFQEAVKATSYSTYLKDRASGNTGHATPLGNHLLAENIADTILPFLKN